MDSRNFGLPQSRRRVYLVGIKKGNGTVPFKFPVGVPKPRPLREFLCDGPPKHQHLNNTNKRHIRHASRLQKLLTPKQRQKLQQKFAVIDIGASRKRGTKSIKPGVFPTITKTRGSGRDYWILPANRRVTTEELMKLQGFNPQELKAQVSELSTNAQQHQLNSRHTFYSMSGQGAQ